MCRLSIIASIDPCVSLYWSFLSFLSSVSSSLLFSLTLPFPYIILLLSPQLQLLIVSLSLLFSPRRARRRLDKQVTASPPQKIVTATQTATAPACSSPAPAPSLAPKPPLLLSFNALSRPPSEAVGGEDWRRILCAPDLPHGRCRFRYA
jgi:hypothetical protein